MNTKLATKVINWMNEALTRADESNDVKTKVDADGKYIRTPWSLCEEIVGQIAERSPLAGKKILVVDTVEFIPVLLAFGAEKCNITYVAPYQYKGSSIAGVIGVRVVQQSLLEWKPDMKFDVVVGNPPYQDGKNNNFYQEFVRKALELSNNHVAMITPSNWISFADSGSEFLRLLKSNGLFHYKFLGSKAFDNVQLITVYFLCSKEFSTNQITLIAENDSVTLDQSQVVYFPTITTKALKIVGKIESLGNNGLKGIKGSLDRNKTVHADSTGVKCIFSAGRKNSDFDWAYIDQKHLQKNGIVGVGYHKVVVSRITSLGKLGEMKYADPTFGCAQACYCFIVRSEEEAKNLIDYCNSKIVRILVSELKGAVCSNSQSVFEFIPEVDFTRAWTDAELYAHFGLTQEEINYIEATIK